MVIGDLEVLRSLGVVLNSPEASAGQDLLVELLLKIRSKTRGLVSLKPNRAQAEYSRCCTKRNIVLKARQLGITSYIAARFFLRTVTQPGTTTVQVAHDQDSAEEIFKIVHRFWNELPETLKGGALVRSRANVRRMIFPHFDSEYRVATAGDPSAGRGMTIHNLHCSEVAQWPRNAHETLASLRATVPEDGEIVMESTPKGAGGVFYDEWQRAEETGFQRHFFPWWYDEAYTLETAAHRVLPLTPEEEVLSRRANLTTGQIAWRRQNRAQLRGLAVQEYAEDAISCFRASGDCVFDTDAIDRALEKAGEPLEVRDNGRLVICFPPQAGKVYIVGADPAGGGSEGDYSCAQVIERASGLQCLELHGHFSPLEFASRLVKLGELYNSAALVVEKNNHGHGVLAHLRREGYQNIYKEGWLTTAVTRPAMIENLAAVLAAEPGLLRTPRLLSECRTFVRYPDGSSAAASGTHDDCVMAMAIALAARQALGGTSRPQVGRVAAPALDGL